jgi:alpha-glucosidase
MVFLGGYDVPPFVDEIGKTSMKNSFWWSSAVIYQIYPRSFYDSNDDGDGDLRGITEQLTYVKDLGVDAIWLSPFYQSPNRDGGYDISDPRHVDPRFGTLQDVKDLISKSHAMNMKVIFDIVPNHFSDQHPWFKDALSSPAGSSQRKRFHFYPGKGQEEPPNNWISLFGGSAWTQVADGEWYLHLFDSSQPDLNWENEEVHNDFERTLRYWLDLGVDGFRIDVAHGLVKDNISDDHPDPQGLSNALRLDVQMADVKRNALLQSAPYFDREGVHQIYREWRRIFDSYDRPILTVAEAWVQPPARALKYIRSDELRQVFNFDLLIAPFSAELLFGSISSTLTLFDDIDALPTWALSNHDSPRLASRIGSEAAARALALAVMALPGSMYIYQGQELGLPDAELKDSDRQDPVFIRTKGEQLGRDAARVPLPWKGTHQPFGFTDATPWLPIPSAWRSLTIESQESQPLSSLTFYRVAITVRKYLNEQAGDFRWLPKNLSGDLLAFERGTISIYLNTSSSDVTIDVENAGNIIMSSHPGNSISATKLTLARESCVWIER